MSKQVAPVQQAQPVNNDPKVAAATTTVQASLPSKSVNTTVANTFQTTTVDFNNYMTTTTTIGVMTTTTTLDSAATNQAQNNGTNSNSTTTYSDTLPTAVGYGVFGLLAIIAIIYIVKFSIDIDRENYKKQMMINNTNFQPTRKPTLNNTPQMNNNVRLSPSIDNNNTSFSSMNYNGQMPYMSSNNSINSNQIAQSQRNSTLHSPNSPNSINQYNTYIQANNYQNGISYTNRQSRQYLLQNNY